VLKTIKKNSQNWIDIYFLLFKAMVIMASFFFHSYECQKIHIKNPFDKILSLSFNLWPLKMSNTSNKSQFCKGLPKGLI